MMTKPFDVQDWVLRMKKRLPHLTEEMLKEAADESINWFSESCLIHPSPILKIIGGAVPMAKPGILALIDKIDGEVG